MVNKKQNLTEAQILRLKAEEKLSGKQKKSHDPVIENDTKRLLHELQVHQIELEMQNEELVQANQTAEMALKKYTMLYDLAPMGYFTLDFEGRISELNFTGAEMLGDNRFSLVYSNFKLFVTDDSKRVFSDFLKKVFSSYAKESCEVLLGYDNTDLRHVYLEAVVVGDDRNCLLSAVDIGSFKK